MSELVDDMWATLDCLSGTINPAEKTRTVAMTVLQTIQKEMTQAREEIIHLRREVARLKALRAEEASKTHP